MAEFIEVREVGLRDGIQNIKTVVPADLKFAWIKAEVAAGVRDIEVCSFVPPKLLPQFADAEEVTKRALGIPGLTVAALMPNLKGAERGAALGVHRLDYVVSVSESHNLNNVRRSTADSLADLQRIADFLKTIPADKRPRLLCGLATSFGCTIEGSVPHDRVVQFAEAVEAMGVDEIALADTVGFGNPNAIRTLFTRVRKAIGSSFVLAAHFHDTRGLGIANVALHEREALVRHGAAQVVEIARIRERVEGDHLVRGLGEEMVDEVGRDESRPAGHEDALGHGWQTTCLSPSAFGGGRERLPVPGACPETSNPLRYGW